MENRKKLTQMSRLMNLIYIGSIIYFIFANELENVFFALTSMFGTIILVYLNKKFDKLFDSIFIVSLAIFILFAGLLGSSFGLYDTIKNYDDFLHIWSGIISCNFAYMIFNYFGNIEINTKKTKLFFIIFMFMFSMGGASLWELMEFTIDKFLGMNCQAGGLVDTMMDTFDCLIGSVVMIFIYIRRVNSRTYSIENVSK